ncbi:MAG: relaxase/mobilization nuclease domain-containing protein [Clostridia bacterium]|nr:relaxase/mobilization nuclease domain-containing protein [Clostridia bacterium]
MAIVECIPEKKQTPSAQKGVIDYCMQPSKTVDEDEQLAYISGVNCVPEMANESFLATQKVFGHELDGVRFYHYVQSFKVGEDISPREAHEIGLELAKGFDNREVLVATHIDREHIHNHLVVCAYDLESGRKLHNNKFFLGELRELSDEICKAHGLEVLEKYDPRTKSSRPGPKEYRAAMNGNSWKIQLFVAIDHCMTRCKSKDEFMREMKKLGYDVVWTPERKYITYILRGEDGTEKRVRDIKLHEEKYRKENMENEFRIRAELYGQAQGEEYTSHTRRGRADGGNPNGANQRRGLGRADGGGGANGGAERRFNSSENDFVSGGEQVRRGDGKGGTGADTDGRSDDQKDSKRSERTGWESEREGFSGHRQKRASGRGTVVAPTHTHGGANDIGIAVMGARGLGDIASIIESDDESEEEKQQREARNMGSAVGLAVGAVIGVALGMSQGSAGESEQAEEENEEEQSFDMKM